VPQASMASTAPSDLIINGAGLTDALQRCGPRLPACGSRGANSTPPRAPACRQERIPRTALRTAAVRTLPLKRRGEVERPLPPALQYLPPSRVSDFSPATDSSLRSETVCVVARFTELLGWGWGASTLQPALVQAPPHQLASLLCPFASAVHYSAPPPQHSPTTASHRRQ
jgi:hypothetical protein